jgi:hypothetical protein
MGGARGCAFRDSTPRLSKFIDMNELSWERIGAGEVIFRSLGWKALDVPVINRPWNRRWCECGKHDPQRLGPFDSTL